VLAKVLVLHCLTFYAKALKVSFRFSLAQKLHRLSDDHSGISEPGNHIIGHSAADVPVAAIVKSEHVSAQHVHGQQSRVTVLFPERGVSEEFVPWPSSHLDMRSFPLFEAVWFWGASIFYRRCALRSAFLKSYKVFRNTPPLYEKARRT